MLKTSVFLVIGVLLGVQPGDAQSRFEIAGYGGYQFWGGLDGFLPNGTPVEVCIKDAANWGGSVGFRPEPNIRFEIAYLNQSTTITGTNRATGVGSDLFDVTIQYIQAGAMYEAPTAGKRLAPYGGLTVGLVNFNPDAPVDSEWRLAFGLNGGLKIYLADNFGLRTQASLLLPIQWGSGGLWCGSGGCSIGVGGGTAILQGALTGGLFVEI